MKQTRRTFLKSGMTTAAVVTTMAALPHSLIGQPRVPRSSRLNPAEQGSVLDDPRIKALVRKAIDAATTAGAQFADVRLTHTFSRNIQAGDGSIGLIQNAESITVGVRALVDGYWGFAASPVWTAEEFVRLANTAVAQAKANTLGQVRTVSLGIVPRVDDKHWSMPVKVDPFELDPVEIIDFFNGIGVCVDRMPDAFRGKVEGNFVKQDKVFGASDGSAWTQRTYRSRGLVEFALLLGGRYQGGTIDLLSPAGEGWELFRDQPIREAVQREMEEVRADDALPVVPVDVGRFPAVFDAASVAALLSQTVGAATELDRALGYEANAGGTSYLHDPATMLGRFKVGAALLSVSGNRTAQGGAATVQWDDESVVPTEFPIVTDGRLVDYATSRESAGWLKDVYTAQGLVDRSHGCAYAPDGVDVPLVHTPNLVMAPARGPDTLDTLTTGMTKGMLFTRMWASIDFQQLNGLAMGKCYDIRNGKRVARVADAGVLFRSPELWSNLIAIGGPASARRFGQVVEKGEPPQASYHSVTAVPVALKEVTLIDAMRKA